MTTASRLKRYDCKSGDSVRQPRDLPKTSSPTTSAAYFLCGSESDFISNVDVGVLTEIISYLSNHSLNSKSSLLLVKSLKRCMNVSVTSSIYLSLSRTAFIV